MLHAESPGVPAIRKKRGRALRVARGLGFLFCLTAGLAQAGPAPAWQTALAALPLPLTIVTADSPRAVLVFVSGDGGWASVDQAVAAGLAKDGVTTAGWSTLRYFATKRTPEQVTADLRRVIDVVTPSGLPIWLGGYSFGSEVVPVVLSRWTAAERARVAGLVLLGPGPSASFRVNPLDWVRDPPVDPRWLVEDAVKKLSPLPILCITGADDGTCICPKLGAVAGVTVARVPGTHHFENGLPALLDAARAALLPERP